MTEPARTSDEVLVDRAVSALQRGKPVVLPTDTVYGLCASPLAPESLHRLKGRGPKQPIAQASHGQTGFSSADAVLITKKRAPADSPIQASCKIMNGQVTKSIMAG